jgi:hypothetical protein
MTPKARGILLTLILVAIGGLVPTSQAACVENALLYVTWDAGHRSSDDDIDAVAALIEMRQEASC